MGKFILRFIIYVCNLDPKKMSPSIDVTDVVKISHDNSVWYVF